MCVSVRLTDLEPGGSRMTVECVNGHRANAPDLNAPFLSVNGSFVSRRLFFAWKRQGGSSLEVGRGKLLEGAVEEFLENPGCGGRGEAG